MRIDSGAVLLVLVVCVASALERAASQTATAPPRDAGLSDDDGASPARIQQKTADLALETNSMPFDGKDIDDPLSPCSSVGSNGSGSWSQDRLGSFLLESDALSRPGSYLDLDDDGDVTSAAPRLFVRDADPDEVSSADGAGWGLTTNDDLLVCNSYDLGRCVFEIMTQDGGSTQDELDLPDSMLSFGKRSRMDELAEMTKRIRITDCCSPDDDIAFPSPFE